MTSFVVIVVVVIRGFFAYTLRFGFGFDFSSFRVQSTRTLTEIEIGSVARAWA